jgi:hypothetical protein
MISYNIYANTGVGDPVDYSTIVDTTSALTWDSPALAANSRWTFAVRAFDTVSGLEESNLDARVSIVVSAAQADVSGAPNPPTGLTVRATAGGGAAVSWAYNPGGQGGAPTGFKVYAGTPAVSYATALATVPYSPGARTFSATLSGLTDAAVYQVTVRAFNASATEANTDTVSFTADATGPNPVDGLAASVIP